MFEFILSLLAVVHVFFRTRRETAIEVLALRQQVAVLKRKRPRPELNSRDRLFWTALRQFWPRWRDVLSKDPPPKRLMSSLLNFWSSQRWCSLLAASHYRAGRNLPMFRSGALL